MPGRTRRGSAAATTKPKKLVLGFAGLETVESAEALDATLTDLLSVEEGVEIEAVFPLTDDSIGVSSWTAFDALAAIDEVSIVAVTNEKGSAEDVEMHAAAVEAGADLIPLGDDAAAVAVADYLVKAKAEGADAKLIVFLMKEPEGEEDPGAQYAALESADGGGVPLYNICDAMDKITFGDSETPAAEEAAPASDVAPTTEEPARRRRRGAAAPAAEAEVKEEPKKATRGRRRAAEATPDEAQQELPIASGTAVAMNTGADEILDLLAELIATKVAAKIK